MPNQAILRLESGLRFSATTGSGFRLELDSRIDPEEPLSAPSPMELQLVALGGCTGMDVISILRKMRQDVTAYDVRLAGERAKDHPQVYTSILMSHIVRGSGLVEANVRRAIQLSMDRYCPVYAMLFPTVRITEEYEIRDTSDALVSQGQVTGSLA